jgi:hypothetical protein
MLPTFSWFQKYISFKQLPSIERFHVSAVTHTKELEYSELLPIEIRYVLAVRPSRHETFHKLLEQNFGIGIRTLDKTPERVLQAVDRISTECQHNTIFPWLERLLRGEEYPVFSEEDRAHAEERGINLYEEVQVILSQRFEFKKFILIPLDNQGISEQHQRDMQLINEDVYPHAVDVIVNRIMFDNAHARTEIAQAIIKALIIIGPIAHMLEHVMAGIGKVFAATTDDLLSETAELFALRGSGFTWRQLMKRSRILIPVFIVATWGAFQVEPLIQRGSFAFAGFVFGLSAVALSLTTAIQSIGLYHQAYKKLLLQGKLRLEGGGLWWYAIRQDFMNPARLGLFIGAILSPLIAAIVFIGAPAITANGWVLALLGSIESIVAGIAVMTATHFNRWRFHSRVRKALVSLLIS